MTGVYTMLCLNSVSNNTYSEQDKQFISALINNDTGTILELIEKGANTRIPITKDLCNPSTYIPYFADQSHHTYFPAINRIESRNQLMKEYVSGYSYPLHVAVHKKNILIVEALLHANAEINSKTSDGFTPLMVAINEGVYILVTYLLNNGADPNIEAFDGSIPLHLAAYQGDENIAEELIKQNANIHKMDHDGETPLIAAIFSNHIQIIELLIKHQVDVNQTKPNGVSPLFFAAQDGRIRIMELLLKAGANIAVTRESDGCSPLQVAAFNGHLDAVKFLIAQGADIAYKDKDGKTALILAQEAGQIGVVSYLKDDKFIDKIGFFTPKSLNPDPAIRATEFYKKHQYTKAIKFFQKALASCEPDKRSSLLCNTAHCYYALKNYQNAVEYYTKCIITSPSSTNAYVWRAKAYKKLAELAKHDHIKNELVAKAKNDENKALKLKDISNNQYKK